MSRLLEADAARAAAVAQHCAANRLMPVPPPELMLCGDGDFRAIGAEFLVHFVQLGGLAPHERVLDLGCGVGRMALPLTQYLGDLGHYDGVDIAAPCIDWCARAITPAYPNFRFAHLDIAHPLYNPPGTLAAERARLPFADGAFDFIALVSVLTHVDASTLDHQAREVARLLAPGGRCFATAFLLNAPSRAGIAAGTARPMFPNMPGAEVLHADAAAPLAAVAYDEDRFLAAFLAAGLRRLRPARYGGWSGRASDVFQDIAILERG
jgi:SAM-dependent methyltransferase